MYECSLERMTDKIKTMSQFGDAGHGGITRYSLSPEALQARGEFVRRMEAIGATIKFDDMANLYATLPGSEPDLPGDVYKRQMMPLAAKAAQQKRIQQNSSVPCVLEILKVLLKQSVKTIH